MTNATVKLDICNYCGKEYSKYLDFDAYLGKNCFDCSFWLKRLNITEDDEARQVIIDGQHYTVGMNASGPFQGFGGRRFTILFHDGRKVETENLWSQGEIPVRFRHLFPDNAVFVETKEAVSTPGYSDIPFNGGV